MKGWQIFIHSVRQVFGNLTAALRVSGLLYLIQMVFGLTLGASFLENPADIAKGNISALPILIFGIVSLITSLWIAVGWHRYVLQIEEPGIVPAWHGDRMLAYFGRSFLIGLIMIPIGMVLGMIVFAAARFVAGGSGEPNLALVGFISFALYVPLAAIAYRFSTILPGIALGQDIGLSEGWEATKADRGMFFGLAVITLVGAYVLGLPSTYLFPDSMILNLIWQFVAGWVQLMVGVSILTTLYGHYIEKRPLV